MLKNVLLYSIVQFSVLSLLMYILVFQHMLNFNDLASVSLSITCTHVILYISTYTD